MKKDEWTGLTRLETCLYVALVPVFFCLGWMLAEVLP